MANDQDFIIINCLEMTQPIGKMYVGIMDHDDLETIAYADIRRLEEKTEKRAIEVYTGIQRPLSENRVKTIGKYVNNVDATFPTSIILHIAPEDAHYDPASKTMRIPRRENVAKVLDGQHRIAGLEKFSKPGNRFQLNVTIFVGMELEDQAIVFATINQTQTKVNQSLVSDLFEFATHRSPQKTAHSIVRALNEKEGSPFKDKIKILGTADDPEKETITQATFVDNLLRYITKDKGYDRDVCRRGGRLERYTGVEQQNRFLRNFFIEGRDADIARIVWNYFSAVEAKWPKAWGEVTPQLILNRSTGFIALMKFLKDAYLHIQDSEENKVPTVDEFRQILKPIELKDDDFSKIRFVPGSSGQSELYKEFLKQSKLAASK